MKKAIVNPILTTILTISVLVSGCSKKNNVAPADPTGTLTTNLGFGFQGGVTLVDDANGYIQLQLSTNLNIYGAELSNLPGSASIANVGAVSGLGAITSHASSGYGESTSATAGTGYVMELTDVAPVPQYYRIYIQSFQLSTSGAVLGATIKYQGPF
jgi:hypothetical protein